jgi:hypothetical protein
MSSELFKLGGDMIRPDGETEADMIEAIRERVLAMMDENPDLLFSYLYRLDVLEHKIKAALKHPEMPADLAIAHLIWERQKQRLQTRKDYGPQSKD